MKSFCGRRKNISLIYFRKSALYFCLRSNFGGLSDGFRQLSNVPTSLISFIFPNARHGIQHASFTAHLLHVLKFVLQYFFKVFTAILAILSSIMSFSSLIPLQNPRPWRASKPGLMSIAWDAFRFTFPVIGTDRGQVPSRCHYIVYVAPGQVPMAVVASAHDSLLFPVD